MKSPVEHKHVFPMHLRLKGETLTIRRFGDEQQDAMIAFARTLPEQDLLFLERDITRPAEVAQWVAEIAHGNLTTILACRDDAIVGYASFDRGGASWTRHVAELRIVVAKSARCLGIGRVLLELVFEMALQQGVTKLVARMTPSQAGARNLFEQLGFEEEAVLSRTCARRERPDTRPAYVELSHKSTHGKTLQLVRRTDPDRLDARRLAALFPLPRVPISRTGRRWLSAEYRAGGPQGGPSLADASGYDGNAMVGAGKGPSLADASGYDKSFGLRWELAPEHGATPTHGRLFAFDESHFSRFRQHPRELPCGNMPFGFHHQQMPGRS